MFTIKTKSVLPVLVVTLAFAGIGAAPIGQTQAVEQQQAEEQPTGKTDQERIAGSWSIVNDDSKRKGEMWVISEECILMYAKHSGANAHLYFHRLDSGKSPKQIDITVTAASNPGGTEIPIKADARILGVIKGIYVLEGDELRLSLGEMGKDRPAAFPAKPKPGKVLVLQRASSGATPPAAKGAEPERKVLTPEEAIKQMPKENVTVQFKVASVELDLSYLYSGYDGGAYLYLKDGGEFTAALICKKSAIHGDQLKKLGIERDEDFKGKMVRVTGRVEFLGLKGASPKGMFVRSVAHLEVVQPKTDAKEQKPNEEQPPVPKELRAEQPKAKGGPPDAKKVLTPDEAIKLMPKENVTVQFKVSSVEVTGWYLGYPATYYVHLKDGDKFTAWLNAHHGLNNEDQIQKLVKKLGIESVTDLRGKVVRVTGRVDESGLRMWVHDPANNVEVVKPKTDGKEKKPNEEKLRVLIDKVLAAHGGEDKLNKLTSFTMTVKHSNGETQHYFVRPPKDFRWETTGGGQVGKRIVILFPEGRRWWRQEPNEDAKEFRPTGVEPLSVEGWFDYVKFFGPRQVLRLKDADHKVALLDEEAKIGDRAAVGVQVTGPHYDHKMYFDKETHLLLKGVASDIVREVTFSDYKKFDGILIAQKEHDGHFDPEITGFKAVDKFDAKLFEQP